MFNSPRSLTDAALGGAVGAALGALLVAALMVFSLGLGREVDIGGGLMPWLALMAVVIVSQFAMAGGLCGLAVSEPKDARR